MANKKPVFEIRLGMIQAAIWENSSGPHRTWLSVTVSRFYKDDGGWKNSSSFGRDDLPVVVKAMEMAYAWIWDHQAASSRVEGRR